VDSVLRGELIRTLAEVCVRFSYALAAMSHLADEFTELAGNALASQGKMEEAAQLLLNGPGVRRESSKKVAVTNRSGSVVGAKKPTVGTDDPIFVQNLDYAFESLFSLVRDGAKAIFKNANELAAELYNFSPISTHQIELPEERLCVTLCDYLVRIRGDDFSGTSFLVSRIAPKKDFLNLPPKRLQEAYKFAMEDCAYQLETDSTAYTTTCALQETEMQNALKPSHEADVDDDALQGLDSIDISTDGGKEPSTARKAASTIATAIAKPLKASSSSTAGSSKMDLVVKADDEVSEAGKKPKKRLSLFGKKLF